MGLSGLMLWDAREARAAEAVKVLPATVSLQGANARQQLVVLVGEGNQRVDATRTAKYESATPTIVQVQPSGVLTPVSDGQGEIRIAAGGTVTTVKVQVTQAKVWPAVDFELDIQPILTKASCNSGACHGKARGQNGFQLSLLAFDHDFDYAAITQEARGRRIFPASPETSLLLAKATGRTPHGGGKRVLENSDAWELLLRWVAAGSPRQAKADVKLEKIAVEPAVMALKAKGKQQVLVTAFYSDGSQRDVTRWTAFQSNESAIVNVNDDGLLSAGPLPGEATIMARFMGQIATVSAAIPLENGPPAQFYTQLPRRNFIDGLVYDKLLTLGHTPSTSVDDAHFLRRAHLHIIGRLPTPDETRQFLADSSLNKRDQLIDRLLERPEYADFWANKWADLLRPNPYRAGLKAVLNFDHWIRDSFRQNKPYDQFVRDLVTAQGSTWHNGAVTMLRDRRTPDELTTSVSQLFLGIRLECAKCHHHPFEVYGQDDFYSFAAYFAHLGRKGQGISSPISGGEEVFYSRPVGEVKHPLTGEVMQPKPLFGTTPEIPPEGDRRVALAQWMTADENPYFSRVIANRIWADLMGRGLVEPVDDLRATNPPSNAPLLDALADHLKQNKYNLKALIRAICTSHVYTLSSEPNERNLSDTRNFSRRYRQRLRGEVLLDAVTDITQVPDNFSAMPPGTRAVEIWTHRTKSFFLDAFGRPDPNLDPPCERVEDTTLVQALHLMNAPQLHQKVTSSTSYASQLASSNREPAAIIEELYLLAYSRFPDPDERRVCLTLFTDSPTSRRRAVEDIMWALVNTPEFIFND